MIIRLIATMVILRLVALTLPYRASVMTKRSISTLCDVLSQLQDQQLSQLQDQQLRQLQDLGVHEVTRTPTTMASTAVNMTRKTFIHPRETNAMVVRYRLQACAAGMVTQSIVH